MIKILLPFALILAWGLAMRWASVRALTARLDREAKPVDDPELEALVRRLGRQVGIDHLRAYSFPMEAINGLAAPDGRLFVTTGLLRRMRAGIVSRAEVASVVAHELGHVARGHHKRRLVDWTGANIARMAAGVALGRVIPIIGPWIAATAASLLIARLSRRDEFEADEYASALMVAAGLGAKPQADMLRKLEEEVPLHGKGVAWLESHPPVAERVAAIEANDAKWRQTPAVVD